MRRRRDQRGAIALLTALLMSVILVVIGGLVVDIGNQRIGRRDMQALSDLVALDMSRQLDGTTPSNTLLASSTWQTALTRSVARNSGTFGRTPTVTAVVGTVDGAGTFTPQTGTAIPNAVRITSATTVAFAFGLAGSGGASRSAVASAASSACFKLGSYAARIDTNSSTLLAPMLNGALGGTNIDALSYKGLAGGNISLGALATQLGVGEVNDLASSTVTLRELYLAAATVLSNNGDVVRANLLNTIATSISSTTQVGLGGLIGASTGGGSAATATIDALDLVSGTAFLANGSNFLSIPSLGTSLGLTGTNLTSTVKLIQGLQERCGKVGDTATTSQADLSISGKLANPISTPSSLLGLSFSAGTTTLAVHAASASGTLTNIVCGAGTTASPQGMDVAVTSQLATIGTLSQAVSVSGSIGSGSGLLGSLLGGLLGNIASVSFSGTLQVTAATLPQSAATATAQIRYPNSPTNWNNPVSTGSGSLGLDSTTVTTTWTTGPTINVTLLVPLLGGTLSAAQKLSLTTNVINGVLSGVATPLIGLVNTTILTPLQSLLGLTLGGADVYGVPTPTCSTPALVG